MLSMHTSPLAQPGAGDAGGMNVYVIEVARRLAALGVEVDVVTLDRRGDLAPAVPLADGVTVRHVRLDDSTGQGGRPLSKEELPEVVDAFTDALLAQGGGCGYDVVHSHYWLSGRVGLAARERWGVPLVHTMHTMARVKEADLALGGVTGSAREVPQRSVGEQEVVDGADMLLANTDLEAAQLVEHYAADPARVAVVPPGVDLEAFRSGDRSAARRALGLPADAEVVLYVGRVQPLKGADVLLRSVRALLDVDPARRERLVLAVVGGTSGAGGDVVGPLRDELGLEGVVRAERPVPHERLRDWYVAADVVAVPSRSESFGLVALEAQACGTPVVAAAVGGLTEVVDDGVSGLLVDGHDPSRWAAVLGDLLDDPERRAALGGGARRHAERFSWDRTASETSAVYRRAIERRATGR
jgi:D-inositol-3-phosphate glycosyltransferase